MNLTRKCRRRKCGKGFEPSRVNQIYCTSICRNRENQRRLRQRAKKG